MVTRYYANESTYLTVQKIRSSDFLQTIALSVAWENARKEKCELLRNNANKNHSREMIVMRPGMPLAFSMATGQ